MNILAVNNQQLNGVSAKKQENEAKIEKDTIFEEPKTNDADKQQIGKTIDEPSSTKKAIKGGVIGALIGLGVGVLFPPAGIFTTMAGNIIGAIAAAKK